MRKTTSIRDLIHRLSRAQDGGVMIFFGVAVFVLFGVAALAVDIGMARATRTHMQAAADSSALAAAKELPTLADVQTRALEYAVKNLPTAQHGTTLTSGDTEVGNWDADTRIFTASATPTNAVRVTLRKSDANGNALPTYLARVIGIDSMDVSVSSIVAGGDPSACLIALDPNASKALELSSGSQVTANGCSVQVNSNDSEAMSVTSGSLVTADSSCVVGGADESSGSTITPAAEEGCESMNDPLASLPPPSFSGCDENNFVHNSGSTTLSPGVYCGGLSIENGSTALLDPGTYIIDGGELKLASGSTMQGTGVSFYLTGSGATVNLESGSHATLTAPTTGPQAGMLFHQDPTAEPGGSSSIASGSTLSFEGVLYFPTQNLSFESNAGGASTSPWTMVVAATVSFQSGSKVTFNSDYSTSTVPLPSGLASSPALVN